MKNENQEYLDGLRHTAAHVLAAAVRVLWPGAQNAIGPAVESGFYQDFDMGTIVVTEEDLPKIEQKMREIVKNWESLRKSMSTVTWQKLNFPGTLIKWNSSTIFLKEVKI